jgi:NAD-dependent SIR2 family protein deacetylase
MNQAQTSVLSLANVLASRKTWLVLTGAGCSTAAGLGDYRNAEGEWKRPQPITGQAFRQDEMARKRYWARSSVGWPNFAAAQPTQSHHAIAQLQTLGVAPNLVTQNVDELHQDANHQRVIDLHGVLSRVVCLGCQQLTHRNQLQTRLIAANPWLESLDARYAPDGDADLSDDRIVDLDVPHCSQCGGLLKPDVVFFGENVPGERVQAAFDALSAAEGLLVIGSSLMVYSGFRFCRKAVEQGKPIVLVNNGVTRADDLAAYKFSGECGRLITHAVRELQDLQAQVSVG